MVSHEAVRNRMPAEDQAQQPQPDANGRVVGLEELGHVVVADVGPWRRDDPQQDNEDDAEQTEEAREDPERDP